MKFDENIEGLNIKENCNNNQFEKNKSSIIKNPFDNPNYASLVDLNSFILKNPFEDYTDIKIKKNEIKFDLSNKKDNKNFDSNFKDEKDNEKTNEIVKCNDTDNLTDNLARTNSLISK